MRPAQRRHPSTALVLASGAAVLAFLDATIVNLALPDVAADFGVRSTTSLSWVVTAYAIALAALLAPAGALADTVGRARLFLVGVAIFTVSSLTAAVAPTFEVLLASRGVQGVGTALMVPASFGLMLAETPSGRRIRAIAVRSAVGAMAAAAGPPIGGLMTEVFGWRSIFCLTAPAGLWLTYKALGLARGETRAGKPPDLAGSLFLALAVGSIAYYLTESPTRGWADGVAIGSLVTGGLAAAGAVVLGAVHPRPALPLDLFRNGTFAVATVLAALFGAVQYQVLMLGVLFLVAVWDLSIVDAGLATAPAALAAALAGATVRRLRVDLSPRALVAVGCSLIAGTAAVLAVTLSAERRLIAVWLPCGSLLGLGIGAASIGLASAGVLRVAPERLSAATGVHSAARQAGGALGVASLTAVMALEQDAGVAAPYLAGYVLTTALAALAVIASLGIRDRSDRLDQATGAVEPSGRSAHEPNH